MVSKKPVREPTKYFVVPEQIWRFLQGIGKPSQSIGIQWPVATLIDHGNFTKETF